MKLTLSEDNNQIYAAKYLDYMPTEEELKREFNLDEFQKIEEYNTFNYDTVDYYSSLYYFAHNAVEYKSNTVTLYFSGLSHGSPFPLPLLCNCRRLNSL